MEALKDTPEQPQEKTLPAIPADFILVEVFRLFDSDQQLDHLALSAIQKKIIQYNPEDIEQRYVGYEPHIVQNKETGEFILDDEGEIQMAEIAGSDGVEAYIYIRQGADPTRPPRTIVD